MELSELTNTRAVSEMITKRCAVCSSLECTVVPVEKISNGTVLKAVHYGNGVTHTWLEYDSIESSTQGGHGVEIKCPKCDDMGLVYEYKPDQRKHPERVAYMVRHERMEGTWGRKSKHFKSRRCYIGAEHRTTILKMLGRYIPERDIPAHPRQYPKKAQRIQCPVCGKPDTVKYDSPRSKSIIYEHHGETPTYYISKGLKKPRYTRCSEPKVNIQNA